MKSILEELFYGNINPLAKQFIRGSDYDKAIKILAENEDKLIEMLNDEGKTLFDDFSNAQDEIDRIASFEYFVDGFRLGAKIMIEILEYKSSCFQDIG